MRGRIRMRNVENLRMFGGSSAAKGQKFGGIGSHTQNKKSIFSFGGCLSLSFEICKTTIKI